MDPVSLDQLSGSEKTYGICTLVNNMGEYRQMIDSFLAAGFDNTNCNFYYIDNTKNNTFDAFHGYRKLLTIMREKYIIFCHQDILINFDNEEKLQQRILEIDSIDSCWALIGNAGGRNNAFETFCRISDPHGENQYRGTFPTKVDSLDENFILLKRESGVTFSNNLSGFHLYGTDLCINADILGFSSYVVDFHLTHKSGGNPKCASFKECHVQFIKKYHRAFRSRLIRTTCVSIFISGSTFLSWLCNLKWVLKRVKKFHRRFYS